MKNGFLSLILHAHLPYVRHPEVDNFLEENWLYEAISETYLPLLRVFNRLAAKGIPYRITFSVSPTLCAMLTDELLQERYIRHLERLIELGEKEKERTKNDPDFAPLASMYRELFIQNLYDFTEVYKKNVLRGFKELQKLGYMELITTAATHSFLPFYSNFEKSVEAQVQTAVFSHGRNFGTAPRGFWIPECGYYRGLERHLKPHNLKYFIASAHGLLFADEKPKYGVYAPLSCPNGVAVFGRDLASSHSVWSESEGYPGDFSYRDFYRDIGYDLPLDYIGPYVHDGTLRVNTGYKYHAITGKTEEKRPYNRREAEEKSEEHAENFLYNRMKQISKLSELMDRPPVIVGAFDAELFGHWWFEGPSWIEHLLTKIHTEQNELTTITPLDYLDRYPENQVSEPSFSSWGNKGYSEVWLNGSNDWIYKHLHKAIERMEELATRFPNEKGLKERVLNQAAREVLLSQASDWPFIMKMGTTVPYAVRRVKEHLFNFTKIYENLCKNTVNTEWLTKIERKNSVFPDIDYRAFAK